MPNEPPRRTPPPPPAVSAGNLPMDLLVWVSNFCVFILAHFQHLESLPLIHATESNLSTRIRLILDSLTIGGLVIAQAS